MTKRISGAEQDQLAGPRDGGGSAGVEQDGRERARLPGDVEGGAAAAHLQHRLGLAPRVGRRVVLLGKMGEHQVAQARTEHAPLRAGSWAPDKAILRAVQDRHSVKELAWVFLWTLFALLAVETLLATRFGRRRI